METPKDKKIKLKHHIYTTEDASSIADDIIKSLDDKGYIREDVEAIADWVQYLSTQS